MASLLLTLTVAAATLAATASAHSPGTPSCLERAGDRVELAAAADTTLYSDDYTRSNGVGAFMYAGRRDPKEYRRSVRRALVRFDVGPGTLPAGSVVTAAELRLRMSDTVVGGTPVRLVRVLAPWGEGDSDGHGGEDEGGEEGGNGARAEPGDATWEAREVPAANWTAPGGDLAANASAVTVVDSVRDYAWEGPGMVRDVEAWRAGEAGAHGWALLADEEDHSIKRFNSRQNAEGAPVLVVRYELPAHACPAAPDAPPGGAYAAGCANSASGQACALSCGNGTEPSDPEGACCDAGTWQAATCEAPCGVAQRRAVLSPAADTSVDSAARANANGGGASLAVSGTSRALLRFDLAEAAAALYEPEWLEVRRAHLRVWADGGGGGGGQARPYAVSEAWGEGVAVNAPAADGDATWDDREFPALAWSAPGGGLPANASAPPSSGPVLSFESAGLRAGVAARMAAGGGAAANASWALVGSGLTVRSRESADQLERPRLVLCYFDQPCHNGVVDARAGEGCDPGDAEMDGCTAQCAVEAGWGCATTGDGPTSSCAALGANRSFAAALETGGGRPTAVRLHVEADGIGRPAYTVSVSAQDGALGSGAAASLEVRAVEPPAGLNGTGALTSSGIAFETAAGPGAPAVPHAALALVVRVPSVSCGRSLGLYERAPGGGWREPAAACAGASPATVVDCVLFASLCSSSGSYALLDYQVIDPNGGGGGGGSSRTGTTFVAVMASLGAVVFLAVVWAVHTWHTTRVRSKYRQAKERSSGMLTDI